MSLNEVNSGRGIRRRVCPRPLRAGMPVLLPALAVPSRGYPVPLASSLPGAASIPIPCFSPQICLSTGVFGACSGCLLRERDRFVKNIFRSPLTAPARAVNAFNAKSPIRQWCCRSASLAVPGRPQSGHSSSLTARTQREPVLGCTEVLHPPGDGTTLAWVPLSALQCC